MMIVVPVHQITLVEKKKRNNKTQWNECENPNKDFEPAKHLRDFSDHQVNWKILLTATNNTESGTQKT